MGFRTPYIHRQTHTHARARVLADHRDVGLLSYTGIDPLPPPPPQIQKAVQHCILPSASEAPGSPPLEATIWIRGCNNFNLTVCKWTLAFLK